MPSSDLMTAALLCMLSTSCILIAYPTFLPFRSPAATDIVHTYVLPVFQAGCQMKQGMVTGIPLLQPGSLRSDGFSLAFLLLMWASHVPAVLLSGSICKNGAGLARSNSSALSRFCLACSDLSTKGFSCSTGRKSLCCGYVAPVTLTF